MTATQQPDEAVLDLFYHTACNETRARAAEELYNRGWFYHKDIQVWIMQIPDIPLKVRTNSLEMGTYFYYDATSNDKRTTEMLVEYDKIEGDPLFVCTVASCSQTGLLSQVFDHLMQAGSLDGDSGISAMLSPIFPNHWSMDPRWTWADKHPLEPCLNGPSVGHQLNKKRPRPVTLHVDLSILLEETILYLFYHAVCDTTRLNAAGELYNRQWHYHAKLNLWLKLSGKKSNSHGIDTFYYYDANSCCKGSWSV